MTTQFPLQFKLGPDKKGIHVASPGDAHQQSSNEPKFTFQLIAKAGQECKEYKLAEISGWPEAKTEMEQACVELPWPIGRVCTDLPRIYTRICTKYVYVNVCYPVGMWGDVEDCIKGAALASAISAVISSPASAGPTFQVVLQGCLTAKGAAWANEVTITAGSGSSCGDWHPV